MSYKRTCETFSLLGNRLSNCYRLFSGDDSCSSSPCLNGATCYDLPDTFICKCNVGYYGDLCGQQAVVVPSGVTCAPELPVTTQKTQV